MTRRMQFRLAPMPIVPTPFAVRSVGFWDLDEPFVEPADLKPMAQLYWVVSGSGEIAIDGNRFAFAAEHVAVYRPGDRHLVQTVDSPWRVCWVTIDGECSEAVIAAFRFPRHPFHVGLCPLEQFHRIESALGANSAEGDAEASALAFEIFQQAAVAGAGSSSTAEETQIKRLIEQHCSDPEFGIDALAAEFGLNRSTIYRRFKLAHGLSPSEYMIRLRIHRSLALLEGGYLTVREIARRCGFNSPENFSKAFRSRVGCSPRQYRNT